MSFARMLAAVATAGVIAATTYSATMAPPAGSTSTMKGTATVKGDSVWVKVTGGTANASYPWHVHVGACGGAGGVFGAPGAYKAMKLDAKGAGTAVAKMSMALPDTGTYYVNVHASAADMKTIVSCGNLTKGK